MAYPLRAGNDLFSSDQRPHFEALYFDTTTTTVRVGESFPVEERDTAIGSGVQFQLFDLLDTSFAPANRAEIETAMLSSSGRTNAILGYLPSGAPRVGVIPNIYMYWGAGAPPGASQARQVLMKFRGTVQTTITDVTLVACGQGNVMVCRNGTNLTGLVGTIKEPLARSARVGLTYDRIQSELGYRFNTTPITLNAGDVIEIYYWHNGEPWGGFGLKAILGTLTPTTFLTRLRDAAVVGTSLMSVEATPIVGAPLPYVLDASISLNKEQVPSLTLTVPLVETDQRTGYRVTTEGGVQVLKDNGNLGFAVRRGRQVHFRAGTQLPSGILDLYPRYVWYIKDINQVSQTEAELVCEGIQSLLTEIFDENYPDYLDYHMHGYVLREGSTEPVFGVPALDNWPIETALALLCYRAGIDAMALGYPIRNTQTFGRRFYRTQDNTQIVYGVRHWRARSLAAGGPVTLERQSNYGNVPPLKNESLPDDDAYLFKPEVTQRLFDRILAIAGQLGYDFTESPDGFLVLRGRNNPTAWQPMTGAGPYATYSTVGQVVSVSAVGGPVFLRSSTDAAWSRQFEGVFSRADLYVGIGRNSSNVNGGLLNVLVERRTGLGTYTTVSNTIVTTYADVSESYVYDDTIREDGTNAAVIRIVSAQPDLYRVTITPAGPDAGQTSCVYRINGVATFEYNPEMSLYSGPTTPTTLTTLGNILELQPKSLGRDQINHVLVVGARKATLSDSNKLDTGANNPAQEFSVAVGVDPFSIYDPSAPNFLGFKRMSVLFDEKVSDTDFALWLVRTLLYRYQSPAKSGSSFRHTLLPVLEPGDAVFVREERHGSINHTLFLSSITESYSMGDCTSGFEADPFPAIASYQPREDLDVDLLFSTAPGTVKGLPAINVNITYKNIYNRVVTNSSLSTPTRIRNFVARGPTAAASTYASPVTSTSSMQLPFSAIPETIYLTKTLGPGAIEGKAGQRDTRVLVNNPYRQFFRISSWSGSRLPTLTFDFQEGDGTAGLYDQSYYGFSTSWYVCYDGLAVRTNELSAQVENPFYDPYTSELGNLIEVTFDQLVSGRVRVSVWAKSDGIGVDVPVAWLTNPTGDPEKPEAHYVYMDAGPGKSFFWDATDTIGLWNTLNSSEWSETIKGAFGDKPTAVGRGFYAWNDRTTNTHTYIGDLNTYSGQYPNFSAANSPHFTIGQFAQFYIKVEVLNDALVRKDMDQETGVFEPRTVDTRALVTANGWNNAAETYVWTHLGEPSQVAIRIQDYIGAGWTAGSTTGPSDWTTAYSAPDQADASFWTGKPVRLTFVPRQRNGIAFALAGNTATSAKLTRQVHLKTMTFDQFVTLDGRGYKGSTDTKIIQPPTGVGKKTVTSRMFHNEDHTLEFEDTDYRSGVSLAAFEWIFDPTQFKKDFGNGIVEALRFADYAQLETLPGFDPQALGGTSIQARSSMLMAFMTYLFYFSAFTIDRSGRRQWCLNSWNNAGQKHGFVDKSKIVTPAWLGASGVPGSGSYLAHTVVDYEPRGAESYLARSVFVRQWKEAYWSNPADTRSPAHTTKFNITNTFERQFLSPTTLAFDLESTSLLSGSSTNTDTWLEQWDTLNSDASYRVLARAANAFNNPIPARAIELSAVAKRYCRPLTFGTWTFDRTGFTNFFQPSPKRDFHPYRRYPYVPDTSYLIPTFSDSGMTLLSSTGGMARERHRDPAAKSDWYGHAWSLASGFYGRGPVLETSVEEAAADGRAKLMANSSNRIEFVTSQAQFDQLFDYVRSDRTDRWDMFRGVISRAPYAQRENTASLEISNRWDIAWAWPLYSKAANTQPVKASGVYLLNAVRYANYIFAPPTSDPKSWNTKLHWTDRMYQFWDYRFQHEYVWYSDRYFPITREGSAAYMYKGNEYTRVRNAIPFPWRIEGDNPTIYYDPGAWTGWKPDIPIATVAGFETSWTSAPYLRWREIRHPGVRNVADELAAPEIGISVTGGEPGMGTGRSSITRGDHGNTPLSGAYSGPGKLHRRANILDEWSMLPSGPRLAVGPESPEARPITMHLALSTQYRGT